MEVVPNQDSHADLRLEQLKMKEKSDHSAVASPEVKKHLQKFVLQKKMRFKMHVGGDFNPSNNKRKSGDSMNINEQSNSSGKDKVTDAKMLRKTASESNLLKLTSLAMLRGQGKQHSYGGQQVGSNCGTTRTMPLSYFSSQSPSSSSLTSNEGHVSSSFMNKFPYHHPYYRRQRSQHILSCTNSSMYPETIPEADEPPLSNSHTSSTYPTPSSSSSKFIRNSTQHSSYRRKPVKSVCSSPFLIEDSITRSPPELSHPNSVKNNCQGVIGGTGTTSVYFSSSTPDVASALHQHQHVFGDAAAKNVLPPFLSSHSGGPLHANAPPPSPPIRHFGDHEGGISPPSATGGGTDDTLNGSDEESGGKRGMLNRSRSSVILPLRRCIIQRMMQKSSIGINNAHSKLQTSTSSNQLLMNLNRSRDIPNQINVNPVNPSFADHLPSNEHADEGEYVDDNSDPNQQPLNLVMNDSKRAEDNDGDTTMSVEEEEEGEELITDDLTELTGIVYHPVMQLHTCPVCCRGESSHREQRSPHLENPDRVALIWDYLKSCGVWNTTTSTSTNSKNGGGGLKPIHDRNNSSRLVCVECREASLEELKSCHSHSYALMFGTDMVRRHVESLINCLENQSSQGDEGVGLVNVSDIHDQILNLFPTPTTSTIIEQSLESEVGRLQIATRMESDEQMTSDSNETTDTYSLFSHLKNCKFVRLECGSLGVDADTYWNFADTAKSARYAVGSLIDLCKKVCIGEVRNGFALIRPPGNHAEYDEAMGFCYFNNVAIAAKQLLLDPHLNVKKILIVDWGIHHGNGTQNMFYTSSSVLYLSLHRHDDGTFYPGTGAINQCGVDRGLGYTVNVAWSSSPSPSDPTSKSEEIGDAEYLAAFRSIVLPIASSFQPDFVLVSCGFDAASGHIHPVGGYSLSTACFAYMTLQLKQFASGRIVLALEGGFNLPVTCEATELCLKALLGEPVSKKISREEMSRKPCASAVTTLEKVVSANSSFWPCLTQDGLEATYTSLSSSHLYYWSSLMNKGQQQSSSNITL